MGNALSNPVMEIDGDVISYIPNSVVYNEGAGEMKVKVESAGGGTVEPIVTENAETKIGMVKFKVSPTSTHLGQIREWQTSSRDGGVTIDLSKDDIQVPFTQMILINNPDVNVGVDGEIELEFEGAPVE